MKNLIAVSSWSLHRSLGYAFENGPGAVEPIRKTFPWKTDGLDLLDMPRALASAGYFRCELCHFHFESLEPAYLVRVRQTFAEAGVVIQTVLIDDGDISHPDKSHQQRDQAWIESWIEAAAVVKAENVRVIAGKQKPTAETLDRSVAALSALVDLGRTLGVKVATENWLDLTPTPREVNYLLDHVLGLGFMADTGNWRGADKYSDLASVFARATLCHAKARFAPGLAIDRDDFSKCLSAARTSGYTGPMTLIFDDDGDEWQGLAAERQFVEAA